MGYLIKYATKAQPIAIEEAPSLKTTSTYNMLLPGKLSYLAGGDTRKQIGTDTGTRLGLIAGMPLGAILAKKHIGKALDGFLDVARTNPMFFKNQFNNLPGKYKPTKGVLGALSKFRTLISFTPKHIRNTALIGAGLLGGVPIASSVLGGVIGHKLTDNEG